jgi:hypothetical protein
MRAIDSADPAVNVADEFGGAALLRELRDLMFRNARIRPRCHGAHYHREQLAGDKPAQLSCVEAFFVDMIRKDGARGREAVRRMVDRFIARFGFRAVDCEGPVVQIPAKSIDQEQLEACVAVSQFHVLVDEAERHGDLRVRREAKRAGDRARAEILDVQRLVGEGR